MSDPPFILLVRMGAFGDILHTLPAAASLKRTIPGAKVAWAIHPRWTELLEGNPDVDLVLPVDVRSLAGLADFRNRTREIGRAVDVQGLLKSALISRISGARRRFGFTASFVRERIASIFYTDRIEPRGGHVVDWNLDLALAAGAGERIVDFPLPAGRAEGPLPAEPFVLAAPFAGWPGKQWPLEYYGELARLLRQEAGHTLVVNLAAPVATPGGVYAQVSGLSGLIDSTRRAAAVVGLDSGPMHLAAALGKPGVALFGPTDPARNGPYGSSLTVLRDAAAPTTYKRLGEILPCMRALTPRLVFQHLLPCLSSRNPTPTR